MKTGRKKRKPKLGGSYSYATVITNNGQITGKSYIPGSSTYHAFLYNGDNVIELNVLLLPTGNGWEIQFWKDEKMKSYITILAGICISLPCFAACSSADLTGDCKVNFADFAIMVADWLTDGTPTPILNGMTWVSISDPGVSSHEGFIGEIGKYETTNAQYCEYLNAALAIGNITVSGSSVVCTSGPYSGHNYYYLAGAGWTGDGATNGGAARINWTGSSFTVDSGFENHPVTCVSWYGATAFAEYYGCKLPTEWQWRAVADYNGSYTYGCGTTINNIIANYTGSTHPDGTTAVGAFGAYGYEICDIAGNVWEWTSSIYSDSYRVILGGGWSNFDYFCSVSGRYRGYQDGMYYDLGFRVCR